MTRTITKKKYGSEMSWAIDTKFGFIILSIVFYFEIFESLESIPILMILFPLFVDVTLNLYKINFASKLNHN